MDIKEFAPKETNTLKCYACQAKQDEIVILKDKLAAQNLDIHFLQKKVDDLTKD